MSPGSPTDPTGRGEGARLPACGANLPQGLRGRSIGAHYQARVVAPSMAKTATEAFE